MSQGINLTTNVDAGSLVYIDLFSAPFDDQSYDNLPLSLATPATFSARTPPKVTRHSMTIVSEMCHNNLKSLMLKVGKMMKPDTVIIFDSYNSLVDGCDTTTPELDLLEFFNSLLPYTHCVSVNRDLLDDSSNGFFQEIKQRYSYVMQVQKNQAGYSKDVHGQLSIKTGSQYHNLKYQLQENKVHVFNSFTL